MTGDEIARELLHIVADQRLDHGEETLYTVALLGHYHAFQRIGDTIDFFGAWNGAETQFGPRDLAERTRDHFARQSDLLKFEVVGRRELRDRAELELYARAVPRVNSS